MNDIEYKALEDRFLERSVDELVDFSFLNYENAGELVGKYRYDPKYTKDAEFGVLTQVPLEFNQPTAEGLGYESFPSFFGQGKWTITPQVISGDITERFTKSKTVWPKNTTCVPIMRFLHKSESGRTEVADEEHNELSGVETIYFGEFFLLMNNIKAIKRFNLMTELFQQDKNSGDFKILRGLLNYPDHTAKGRDTHFVRWSFGFSPVDKSFRPPFLEKENLTPSPCKMVHTESRRRWHAMRDNCLSWITIYDKTNFSFELHKMLSRPGSTLCQIKAEVDWDKVREYLDEQFIHETYINQKSKYSLALYPPSIYMYPADSVTKVIEPLINSVNRFTDKIIFEAPRTFKTDGNFHYMIQFFRVESDKEPFFVSSSYPGDDDFERGKWFHSEDDMKSFTLILGGTPTFNNRFEEGTGSDAVFSTHIKYNLGKELFSLVRDSSSIIFKIHQIDGTRTQYGGRQFSVPFDNDS